MEPEETNEKPSQRKFLTWITIVFTIILLLFAILSYYLVFLYPENQVSQLGITNITEKANFINQYRTTSIQLISTLAQILGGSAVLVGIYFAWKNFELAQATLKSDQEKSQKDLEVALTTLKSDQEKSQKDFEVAQATLKHNQEVSQKNLEVALATLESNMKNAQDNLKVAQEGQITERFTRAVDQLGAVDKDGNPAIEIRLGGIYALERIANESKKDYWPIMEILTAYVRNNSPVEKNVNNEETESTKKLSIDIQTILNVIKRCNPSFKIEENNYLDLSETYLWKVNFIGANLKNVDLSEAYLKEAILINTDFEKATLNGANFTASTLIKAKLIGASLMLAQLKGSNLDVADLKKANLFCADLKEASLQNADLEEAILLGAKGLTIDQLSKVKTLYNAELDEELEKPLREKYPALFEEPDV